MRVVVIGGTEFIGRRLVETLVGRGDEVLVVHRGRTEPEDAPSCAHLHVDRREFATVAGQVRGFRPDAVVDTIALTGEDVEAVLPHLPEAHLVVLSSCDVYRVYELLLNGDETPMPVPVDEGGPLRLRRYPFRGKGMDLDDYDKLDVEPAYLCRGGTVLRLGMVYGHRDPQRREEFVLRRVRAGRDRIPVGPGTTLTTRLHVDDAARAVLAALDRPDAAAGEVFNVGETTTYSVRAWIRLILAAAGHAAELVPVPEESLPADLGLTRAHPQHILMSSQKATDLLGWCHGEPATAVRRSVRWHLDHPPGDPCADFTADDAALSHAI
ncbi:MAG TPA: NAD-dependent epimerase/dehydratase family protein [Jiangellales bacterium]|nr:NAD-dependent epimerase/dehydratase family protein [Jiangellales bacterium]